MRSRWFARVLFVVLSIFNISCFAADYPTFDEVKRDYAASDALLLDRNGVVLQALRLDKKVLRLPWVALDDLSLAMRDTLVLAEDKNFYEHGGVDWKAVVAAAWGNVTRRSKGGRGASTLTMQLAGLLDPVLKPAKDGSRTLSQKWDQMGAARVLEKTWSKPDILEAYFNLVPFRGELIGINAASQRLFGKHPSGLDRNEALLLAALLRGPNASGDKVSQRACTLGRSIAGDVDCKVLHDLAIASFESSYQVPQQDLAPHLARRLLAKPGEHVTSTLSKNLQRFALDAVQQHLMALKERSRIAPFPLFLTGFNLMGVSLYMRDAPFRQLQLLGGDKRMHDWYNLFQQWVMLSDAEWIADLTYTTGMILCIGSIITGLYLAFRLFSHPPAPASISLQSRVNQRLQQRPKPNKQ